MNQSSHLLISLVRTSLKDATCYYPECLNVSLPKGSSQVTVKVPIAFRAGGKGIYAPARRFHLTCFMQWLNHRMKRIRKPGRPLGRTPGGPLGRTFSLDRKAAVQKRSRLLRAWQDAKTKKERRSLANVIKAFESRMELGPPLRGEAATIYQRMQEG